MDDAGLIYMNAAHHFPPVGTQSGIGSSSLSSPTAPLVRQGRPVETGAGSPASTPGQVGDLKVCPPDPSLRHPLALPAHAFWLVTASAGESSTPAP